MLARDQISRFAATVAGAVAALAIVVGFAPVARADADSKSSDTGTSSSLGKGSSTSSADPSSTGVGSGSGSSMGTGSGSSMGSSSDKDTSSMGTGSSASGRDSMTWGQMSKMSPSEQVRMMDADHDGYVSKEEFMKFQQQLWNNMDKNNTGRMSYDQFLSGI